ncbi:membrane protein [Vibrio variabilis]|uniref:Membrane protein n=1 Tax=Vibrio variabilis TaxID=990271 RepID=A0ABR4YEY2_9VIBR|nr:VTT domain-containing protein [Vibrio variabilis]KHA62041.1 membrane protein [Vibrio variabilis]
MIDFATTMEAWLFQDNLSLSMLFVGVVLLSYLLEDLAIITAATLSVEHIMPPSLALAAIFIGISSGDMGLYLLGKLAKKVAWFRYRLLRYHRARKLRRTLHQQAFKTLFIVRFVPGLRTVGFTLSGFLDVPKVTFLLAVITATGLWTLLVFSSFFQLGNAAWLQESQGAWLLIPAGLCLMLLINKLITRTFLRDAYDTAR